VFGKLKMEYRQRRFLLLMMIVFFMVEQIYLLQFKCCSLIAAVKTFLEPFPSIKTTLSKIFCLQIMFRKSFQWFIKP